MLLKEICIPTVRYTTIIPFETLGENRFKNKNIISPEIFSLIHFIK